MKGQSFTDFGSLALITTFNTRFVAQSQEFLLGQSKICETEACRWKCKCVQHFHVPVTHGFNQDSLLPL